MAAPALGEHGPTERLQFLDAVRGFALLLMIVNHTGRWWQDGAMGWPRSNLIYASMAVGAPLFLFLVGFCMPLSFARRRPTGSLPSVAAKFLQRGARLILASWLLNFVVFRDEPFWEGGVLQTIGLGIIPALPPMLLLPDRAQAAARRMARHPRTHVAHALLPPSPARAHPRQGVAGHQAERLVVVRRRQRGPHGRAGPPGQAVASDQEHRGPTTATRLGAEPMLISGRTH
jgi:predicted acyltransferase